MILSKAETKLNYENVSLTTKSKRLLAIKLISSLIKRYSNPFFLLDRLQFHNPIYHFFVAFRICLLIIFEPTKSTMKKQYNLTLFLSVLFLTAISVSVVGQNVPGWASTSGLVAYYSLNGNTIDSSGNQLDGTGFGSVTYTTGRNGVNNSAMDFNGFNTYIEVQDDEKLRFRNGSIVYWIKTSSTSPQTIITKSNFNTANNEMYTSSINFPNPGMILMGAKYNSNCVAGTGWRFNQGMGNVNNNQWIMMACVIRPDSLIIYRNGVKLLAETALASQMDSCAGGSLRIGRNWISANNYFSGSLDDIFLYNRPLTSQEIQTMYTGCPSVPQIVFTGTTSKCVGDTVTLTSSNLFGNTWSTGDTTRSIRVFQSGSFSVTTSNSNCSVTSSPQAFIFNNYPPIPVITPNGPTTFCSGGSVVLSSSSSVGNLWSNNSTNSSIIISQTGSYTLNVFNGACSSTSLPISITVNTSPPIPTVTPVGPTTFCDGRSVTLISSNQTGNLWSNNATTNSINVTQSGNYTVTASNGNCTSTSLPVAITVLSAANITTQPTNQSGFVLGDVKFILSTTDNINAIFRWQTDAGFGFQNLTNAGQYNGVNNDTLQVSNLSLSNSNQLFRCITTKGTCSDTSNIVSLVVTTGVSVNNLSDQKLEVYPNPSQTVVWINTGFHLELVPYELMSIEGKIVQSGMFKSGVNTISLEEMPKGIYVLRTQGANPGWAKINRN